MVKYIEHQGTKILSEMLAQHDARSKIVAEQVAAWERHKSEFWSLTREQQNELLEICRSEGHVPSGFQNLLYPAQNICFRCLTHYGDIR